MKENGEVDTVRWREGVRFFTPLLGLETNQTYWIKFMNEFRSSNTLYPSELLKIISGTKEKLLRLLFGLIQFIDSTRPKCDVWPNWRS